MSTTPAQDKTEPKGPVSVPAYDYAQVYKVLETGADVVFTDKSGNSVGGIIMRSCRMHISDIDPQWEKAPDVIVCADPGFIAAFRASEQGSA